MAADPYFIQCMVVLPHRLQNALYPHAWMILWWGTQSPHIQNYSAKRPMLSSPEPSQRTEREGCLYTQLFDWERLNDSVCCWTERCRVGHIVRQVYMSLHTEDIYIMCYFNTHVVSCRVQRTNCNRKHPNVTPYEATGDELNNKQDQMFLKKELPVSNENGFIMGFQVATKSLKFMHTCEGAPLVRPLSVCGTWPGKGPGQSPGSARTSRPFQNWSISQQTAHVNGYWSPARSSNQLCSHPGAVGRPITYISQHMSLYQSANETYLPCRNSQLKT